MLKAKKVRESMINVEKSVLNAIFAVQAVQMLIFYCSALLSKSEYARKNTVFYAPTRLLKYKYITGGQDRGIETWNPVDGRIEAIVAEMPMESGCTKAYRRAKIISINKNTELVFFGGLSDNLITEVWKYKYASSQWEFLGNIQIGRYGHLAVPVIGMKCP